ncbi:ZF-HD homeobox protein family [Cinnamomum micranthum f. kanehirae]|uniref:ZF-HD homeobox protein family n=1 Tax=Cinnamomum micranthum f. kanehirae TaxID=337451 RepID=A0A443NFP9_9MAGN|nr:ZF-HD homeobox protein family [Cinnamomum micranthum f. kanehirae]
MESDNKRSEVYRECLRNHAASLGSYATDGCGEFISDDSSGGGLQCAACGCHRNFHRKVVVGGGEGVMMMGFGGRSSAAESGKKRVRTKFSGEQKEKMLKFAEKIGWRIQRKDHEDDDGDDEIERFCREVGVSRQVFKVWIHNHKNSSSSSSSLTQ